MHLAFIKYSVLRLSLFVGSLALLWAVGVRRSLLMLVLAALISLALSYILLSKQRNELATGLSSFVEGRVQRRAGIGQADADEEDAVIARAEAAQSGTAATGVTEAEPTGPTSAPPAAARPASSQSASGQSALPQPAAAPEAQPERVDVSRASERSERQADRQ